MAPRIRLLWALSAILANLQPATGVIVEDLTSLPPMEYDFVIVGGGTAGCVLANRLTENPLFNVLVIEAGNTHEDVLDVMVPAFAQNLIGSQYDWNYTSIPQTGLDGRTLFLPRGQILGGTSAMHFMAYTRGSASDYDRWATVAGDPGWCWDSMFPYMLKGERWSSPPTPENSEKHDPAFHSTEGILGVSLSTVPRAVNGKLLEASAELGGEFAYDRDMNDGTSLGLGWVQSTISNGTRSSAASSYLGPAYVNRDNLHVLVKHRVVSLGETASSEGELSPSFREVSFVKDDDTEQIHQVTATKEVILSAGTYGTPQILMLSGIGDPAELQNAGIASKVDLPSVGKNLTDHVIFRVQWDLGINATIDPFANQTLVAEALEEWHQHRTGFLTAMVAIMFAWIRLPESWPLWANFSDNSSGPDSPHLEILPEGSGLYPLPGPSLGIHVALASPQSRGSVGLSSNDPFQQPLINSGLLTAGFDVAALVEGVKAARRLVGAQAFAEWNLTLSAPFAEALTDIELYEVIKSVAQSGAHVVGTATMSPADAGYGVVNPDLRVKSVSGLRVVDASVMPHVPVGHIQASVYAVAERAADLIKSSW
ncbi:aryl-alcohol oxidase [Coprinopsis sp. MPI-PUGE-AT-0042]|nr:aryl-alcohol oxidase [Coprinopsis sp. MPI-PUGE-AT-0042]